ncbi:hypothetical protein B0H11DRAFT_1932085 [Mycena galericulata]|nr:hypothetical protein B0H11DRAFT_1932085 [Mycena galericulata]
MCGRRRGRGEGSKGERESGEETCTERGQDGKEGGRGGGDCIVYTIRRIASVWRYTCAEERYSKGRRVTMRSWRHRRFAVGKRRRSYLEGEGHLMRCVGRVEGGRRCCRITARTDIVVEDKEVAITLPDVFTHLLSQRRPNSSSRLRSYKLDGPGVVYIVGRVRTAVYNSYIAKQTSSDDFLDALEVKVGHSKSFKARRRAYKRCAGEHTLFWHATYTTRHRMLLESIVHQHLKNIGAALRSVSCACMTQHREFSSFVRTGGFPGVDDIVEKCLGALGETNFVRNDLKKK